MNTRNSNKTPQSLSAVKKCWILCTFAFLTTLTAWSDENKAAHLEGYIKELEQQRSELIRIEGGRVEKQESDYAQGILRELEEWQKREHEMLERMKKTRILIGDKTLTKEEREMWQGYLKSLENKEYPLIVEYIGKINENRIKHNAEAPLREQQKAEYHARLKRIEDQIAKARSELASARNEESTSTTLQNSYDKQLIQSTAELMKKLETKIDATTALIKEREDYIILHMKTLEKINNNPDMDTVTFTTGEQMSREQGIRLLSTLIEDVTKDLQSLKASLAKDKELKAKGTSLLEKHKID